VDDADQFFMRTSPVHHALAAIARILDEADVPYAIAGAMALDEYGYERVTRHVDVLDVQELIKHAKLPRALGIGSIPTSAPGTFELWDAAQAAEPE